MGERTSGLEGADPPSILPHPDGSAPTFRARKARRLAYAPAVIQRGADQRTEESLDGVLPVDGPNPWSTVAEHVVFDNGRMRLREDEVVQPDGRPGTYTFVDVPWPIVGIIPIDSRRRIHLVRQWRYPWGRNSWEIPAGHCEPGESPLDGAVRELAEEVGVAAGRWTPLGVGHSSASMNARYHLFLAEDLTPIPPRERDGAEEDLIVKPVAIETAVAAALDGTLLHAFTVVGVLRAARRLGV